MSNKENRSQPKVAKVPCAKLILNKHHPPAKSTKGATKPSYATNVIQGAAHTQKHVLVHIQSIIIIKLNIIF
jgi:hypothetical protein